MIRRSPLLLASALLFGACQGVLAPQTAGLGEPFWLGYHETVIVPTSAGTIRFTEVLEDSRCPSDDFALGFVIELLDVDPPRSHSDPAPLSRYRARLLITAVR